MKLGVNIDHVATLREIRSGIEPEPVFAALLCQAAGADSIVAHLREDRRHIKERDVSLLREVVKVKFNLEMSIADDIVDIACKIKPDQATIVPEKRREVTTEGGLDAVTHFKKLKEVSRRLEKAGIEVSFFIDPEQEQIDATAELGIPMIELHTGRYADARSKSAADAAFSELKDSAEYARKKRLQVFAGHGLNYYNVSRILQIPAIEELNIGYSIVCRAVVSGLPAAVREMKALIDKR